MTLFDRQHLDQIIEEQDLAANMRFSDEDYIKIGHLINVRYFLTGSMQKLPGGEYAVSFSITESSSGVSRASFMENGTPAAVRDGTLLNAAAESLLAQMGITLTETGRRTLRVGRYMTARAEAGYAQGVAAEASGQAVEALLNYSQAVAFDPSRLEALTRLGSVSSEISGGSVSASILNDLQARDAWLAAFKEAAAFFNSRPPFEITYDPNLFQIGGTDYVNRRADIAMRISLMPSEAGFGALNALLEGLEKTGKRETWGFAGWPLLDITPKKAPEAVLFPGKRFSSFTVEAGLVNEAGKVIGRGRTTLKTGEFGFKAGDKTLNPPEGEFGQIDFLKVNAGDLTPTLTVVIAGVNGIPARQISETGSMRIVPGDVARMEQARMEQARMEQEKARVEREKRFAAEFVFVEGGTFQMGSPASEADRKDNETPHQVTVGSFYMGKYEVTQKEWREVMGNNPSDFRGDSLPVESVSWYDAVEYCNRRSQKEGLSPAYTIVKDRSDPNNRNTDDSVRWQVTWNRNADGYRLPTEAEWEYACRAGTTTPFNTGNNIGADIANYDGNHPYNNGSKGVYRQTTTAAGSFPPNPWGLYDMHGNVWEWCWDWYEAYASGAQTDPTGAGAGAYRVLRGGSWYSDAVELRSAVRGLATPSDRSRILGFRLVRP
jgi:formylglycine-generating enzyme required for sulfatase activity